MPGGGVEEWGCGGGGGVNGGGGGAGGGREVTRGAGLLVERRSPRLSSRGSGGFEAVPEEVDEGAGVFVRGRIVGVEEASFDGAADGVAHEGGGAFGGDVAEFVAAGVVGEESGEHAGLGGFLLGNFPGVEISAGGFAGLDDVDAEEVAAFFAEFEDGGGESDELVVEAFGPGEAVLFDFGEGFEVFAEGGGVDVGFGFEVEVDGALGDAGLGGDVVDECSFEAVTGEDAAGGGEDFRFTELGDELLLGGGGFGHRVSLLWRFRLGLPDIRRFTHVRRAECILWDSAWGLPRNCTKTFS